MKYIKLILVYAFLITPSKLAISNANIPGPEEKIAKIIAHLQPKMSANNALKLAKIVSRLSAEYDIDYKLSLAIMFQESSLRLDPHNCKVNLTACNDMGIGQVRYSVWGKELKIDKVQIVTNLEYSVKMHYEVLRDYKKRYKNKELNWFTRYHSNDSTLRYEYMQRLNKVYHKINTQLSD